MWATSSIAGAGQRQGRPAGQPDGRGRMEVEPVGEEPVVVGVGPGQREDPPLPGDAGGRGGGGRAHDDGRPLVDLHVGGEQLGVRVVDHPVGVGDGDDLVHRAGIPEPGVGIGGGHLGESGPQRTDAAAVVVEGAAEPGAEGVLEEGDTRGWAGRAPGPPRPRSSPAGRCRTGAAGRRRAVARSRPAPAGRGGDGPPPGCTRNRRPPARPRPAGPDRWPGTWR